MLLQDAGAKIVDAVNHAARRVPLRRGRTQEYGKKMSSPIPDHCQVTPIQACSERAMTPIQKSSF
jgi:hypothetical protein